MKNIELNNGMFIPQMGFGTYKITSEKILDTLIPKAFELGYSLLDTANYYNNEKAIGDTLERYGLQKKIKVCTKIWPKDFGRDRTLFAVEKSLKDLKLDSLEILFLHWPSEDFQESWRALEEVYEQGYCRSIAVSNFHKNHLDKLFVNANIKPVIDQLETHPLLQQRSLKEFLDQQDIRLEAWSPLARNESALMDNEIIRDIASLYKKSPQQIVIRWHLEKNHILIPKSSHAERLKENIEVFDFNLTEEEIKAVDSDSGIRVSQDPDDEDWLQKIREK